MDIQFDSVPFQIVFYYGPEYNAARLPVKHFYEHARLDGAIEPAITIKENIDLAVSFSCADAQAKLYMDGLDALPQDRLVEDSDGRSYLSPDERVVQLFSHADYPLIPGYYWIEVVVSEQHYFAPLRVEPKQMSRAQWEVMRQELNDELYGLALDLIRQSTGVGSDRQGTIPLELLHRFMVIRQRFPSVMAALNDLLTRANYHVRKTYQRLPVHRVRGFDDKTARYQLTRRDNSERLLTSVPTVDYDLPENRWVKHILRVVSDCLGEFCQATQAYACYVAEQADELAPYTYQANSMAARSEKLKLEAVLQEYVEAAEKMTKAIELVRQAPWYHQVGRKLPSHYPQALFYDARYSALYGLHRQLRAETVAVVLDDAYAYQWKRTDQLYELWCFVKLYRALAHTAIGFVPTSGWLFDEDFDSGSMLIPVLPAGTRIILRRDDVTLHLVYDAELPRRSSDAEDGQCPLFTRGIHSRPDGRLDIYDRDMYVGSIVFDFKYRPLPGFWDQRAIDSSSRPKAMNQLISYASEIRSPYLTGKNIDPRWRQSTCPIHEVWAIFPGVPTGKFVNELHSDHSVRLVSLAPETDMTGFVAALATTLDDVLAKVK